MTDHVDAATEVSDGSSFGSGRSTGDAKEISGSCAAWTNEKHDLYLHSLEASFLKQLQQSMSLRGCLQKDDCRKYSSIEDNECSSLQQITVRRYSKQRIKCEGNDDLLESTSDSHSISVDTEHAASSDLCTALGKDGKRMRNNESPVSSASTQSSNGPDEWSYGDEESVPSYLEVSDQNFVDEDAEYKSSGASRLKRSKIDAPNDHQFSAFYNTEGIT